MSGNAARERLSENRPVQSHHDATYDCTSADGQNRNWRGTVPARAIKGTVFIDGSATTSLQNNRPVAKYAGKGTIILSGLYTMDGNNALRANLSSDGKSCHTHCGLGR